MTALLLLFTLIVSAQSYNDLWVKVDTFSKKDLPKSEIETLNIIKSKATKEKKYGQLVAAERMLYIVKSDLMPDSVKAMKEQLKVSARLAEKRNPALAAVYYCVLNEPDSALKHMDILARTHDSDYSPLVSIGVSSEIFNHDLLHVIGIYLNRYNEISRFYANHGNRRAAFVSAVLGTNDINTLDSLINNNSDLDEAVYAMGIRAKLTRDTSDAWNYTSAALEKHGNSQYANTLTNIRSRLEQPRFEASLKNNRLNSSDSIAIKIKNMVNTKNIKIGIRQKDEKKILNEYSFDIPNPSLYIPHDTTLLLPPEPIGEYDVLVCRSDTATLYYSLPLKITDLSLIVTQLPSKDYRTVVLDSYTGYPRKDASVRGSSEKDGDDYNWHVDNNGEVLVSGKNFKNSAYFQAYTDSDELSPYVLAGTYVATSKKRDGAYAQIITDRAIYRPGQTIHSAAIAFSKTEGKVLANIPLAFVLSDADWNEIDTVIAKTDEYGTATADFNIPKHTFTGRWKIEVSSDLEGYGTVAKDYEDKYKIDESHIISVEEYKRPTFYVTIDNPDEGYHVGDTLSLKAKAMSYTGVPVRDAKVVVRAQRVPWIYYSDHSNYPALTSDTLQTDNDGAFIVRVPLIAPNDKSDVKGYWSYYNAMVSATVTDAAGESQQAKTFIPFSRHSTKIDIETADKVTTDKLKVCFNVTNLLKEPINGTVRYRFDNDITTYTAPANDTISISLQGLGLSSGEHELHAYSSDDSTSISFTFIDFNAKRLTAGQPIFLAAERKEFKGPKDEIRVQMGTSMKDVYVIYSVYTSNKVLEYRREIWNDELMTRTFKYNKSYGEGLYINIAFVKDGELYQKDVFLSRPVESNLLDIAIETFRDKVTPGATETFTLSVKDPSGKPANAQMIATIYDAALEALQKYDLSPSWGLTTQDAPTIQAWWNADDSRYYRDDETAYVHSLIDILPEKGLYFSHFLSEIIRGYLFPTTIQRLYNNNVKTSGTINGIVVDSDGEPIIGAAIVNKRSGEGAVSNLDGLFAISANEPASLEVSYVGYESQKISAVPGDFIVVTMKEDEEKLNEVVVVGYGTTQRAALTGAVNGVAASERVYKTSSNEESTNTTTSSIRSNFNETALWAPRLHTDGEGKVSVTFTLPESLTSWMFQGFAHDKNMRWRQCAGEMTASKELMVQPNVPRFIRRGDNATISTRITNSSKEIKSGTAILEIINPENDSVVYNTTEPFAIGADSTTAVEFNVNLSKDSRLYSVIPDLSVLRITAKCDDGNSDGEQHYLPVLPDREPVVNTAAATLRSGEKLTVDIDKLFSGSSEQKSLIVDYVKNPDWLVVKALASIYKPSGNSATDIMCNLYSTALTSYIIDNDSNIKVALRQIANDTTTINNPSWAQDEGLLSIIREEMPWSAMSQRLVLTKERADDLLNEDYIEDYIDKQIDELKKLQNSDGSFSWYPGMKGSTWMTVAVTQPLVKLQKMTGEKIAGKLISKSLVYLYKQLAERVAEVNKKPTKHNATSFYDSDYQLLYTLEMGRQNDSLHLANSIINDAIANPQNLTIYGKAVMANILANHGNYDKAHEFLESIRQYSVKTPTMGIYFDTNKAQSTWLDYKIPSVVAAIDAFRTLEPNDTAMINGMCQWLLEEKRTQVWDTPLNSVDAIYALGGLTPALSRGERGRNKTCGIEDGKRGKTCCSKYAEQKYYVGSEIPHKMTFENTGNGTQWINIYAKSIAQTNDNNTVGQGFSISREIIPNGEYHVGDKVKVRITVHADRDYDCVSITDNRPSCMEPVNQESGYDWALGCYTAMHDTHTDYFFDKMAKGDYVIEREYFIDKTGSYGSGSCSVQCTYSPAFMARTNSSNVTVSK